MKIFDHPNLDGFVCPICLGSEDAPVVLIPIEGTQKEGIMKAQQYHVGCISLTEYSGFGMRSFLFQEVAQ
jgi:hypothetical protein